VWAGGGIVGGFCRDLESRLVAQWVMDCGWVVLVGGGVSRSGKIGGGVGGGVCVGVLWGVFVLVCR